VAIPTIPIHTQRTGEKGPNPKARQVVQPQIVLMATSSNSGRSTFQRLIKVSETHYGCNRHAAVAR
jgi:hypothetical protein